jgi:hypothetical protein
MPISYLQSNHQHQTNLDQFPKHLFGMKDGGINMKVNLDGSFEQAPRFLLDEDSYEGSFVDVSDVYETVGFENQKVEKIRFLLSVTGKKEGDKQVVLPFFATAVVTKASDPKYSDSKLYTLIESSGEIENFSKMWETVSDMTEEQQKIEFVGWLKSKLLNRKVKFITKTATSKDNIKYSVVDKIVKFI